MRYALLVTCAATMLIPMEAYAQGSATGPTSPSTAPDQRADEASQVGAGGAADIIVTAQKRSESVQSIPAAVTVVSGQGLAQAGITDQTELGKLAPGAVLGAQAGHAIVFLRGVGQTQTGPNNSPAVALSLDGMYLPPESGLTPLYDMERVEVLPGPQGTLYGRASAGGAINFISKKPTKDYSANFFVEAGNYDAVQATGAINVPLGSDFAVRLAGIRQVHDGYLSNGLEDQRMWSGRLTLSYDSSSPFSATVTLQRHHEGGKGRAQIAYTGDAPNPYFPDPGDLYEATFPYFGQYYRFNSSLATATLNLDLSDDIALSYTPGYMRVRDEQFELALALFPATFSHKVDQYTQELKLNGRNSSGDWVAGFYWLHAPNHVLDATIPFLGRVIAANSLKSYAGFAEYRYRASDEVTLIAGGRYSHDRFKGRSFVSLPPFNVVPLDVHPSDSRGRADFKAGVNYQITPRSLLYGAVQTGYIAAGFDQYGAILKPSKLTSFTVGSKNRFFDNALTANLELFYYDYRDFQLQYNNPDLSFGSASVPARVMGAELFLGLKLGSADNLGLSVLYQKAEMRDKSKLYLKNDVVSGGVSVYGYQLPNAPDLTINGNWSHTFNIGDEQRIIAQVNVLYSSSYWMVFTHDIYTRQKAYTRTDATLKYHSRDDRWSFGLFVRNVENKAVMIGGSKSGGVGITSGPYLRAPRTYGISFGGNF